MADSLLPPGNLFAELPAELSRGLFEKARSIALVADQMLFLAGDAGNACYRVEDGLLKASVFAPEGGERILAIRARLARRRALDDRRDAAVGLSRRCNHRN